MSNPEESKQQNNTAPRAKKTEVPIHKELVGAVVLAQMISVAVPDPMVNRVLCDALRVMQKTLADDANADLDKNVNGHPEVVALANNVQEMATKMQ